MPPSGVLLTGGTGFVGAELLARYLERSDRPVYALVRAASRQAGEERLREKLSPLLGTDAVSERLVAVPGDIESPGLGLSEADRDRLAGGRIRRRRTTR